jgi:hypothetical protein
MDGMTSNTITVNNKLDGGNHYLEQGGSSRRRNENDDDDEGASWSIGSSGGMSQSSHDDGVIFQSEYIFVLILTSSNFE